MKGILQVFMTIAVFLNFLPSSFSAPTNKVLKIGMTQEFENLNPLIMSMLATSYIYKIVGRNLLTLNENGEWTPHLTTVIPTFKNGRAKFIGKSPNKKISALWEIRSDAKWGDGKDVTCADIKFSWKVALSSNVSIGEKEVYSQIEKITWPSNNPKKCTFSYEKAKWDFNRIATFYILPMHLEKAPFDKYGHQKEGYEKNSNYSKNPTNPGLYNGPYRIKEIKLGSHVTVVPNKHFYGEKPKIQKIILKLIPNTSTLEANLRSGTIDMISVLGLSFDQALAFEKKVKGTSLPYDVNFKDSLVYEHIDLNLDNELLKDINVRKALVYAINRKELTRALFDARQKPALHNVAPMDPWYTDNPDKIVIYKYSRRKAKKLLKASGWKKNKDGFLYKNGKKLKFTLMTTAGNKVRELVEAFLQNQWKSIGIDIEIKNQPARVYFGETTRKRKFSAMAMYAWISSPENNPRSNMHSKSISRKSNGFSGQNYPGWVNKNVDKLIDDLDVEFDGAKRTKLVHKILYYYTNEVPVIPLYYRSDVSVTPTNLINYKLPGHQFSSTNHVEEWTLN